MKRERLSLNQYTVRPLSLIEAADLCVRHEIGAIGLWRDKIPEIGVKRAAEEIAVRGLHVSSICRGGFFPAPNANTKTKRHEENLHAIDETAALGAGVLVLVCGPLVDRDLADARTQIEEGITALVPYARSAGIRLGIEPLHPMLITTRSAVTTLREANDLVERIGAPDAVGVVADTYNIFWDARVNEEIARAGKSIFAYQLADWISPDGYPDVTAARGLIGDGCIDFAHLGAAIESAGYTGPIEIEILNSRLWEQDPDVVVGTAIERFERCAGASALC